jgi:hypothetical protein
MAEPRSGQAQHANAGAYIRKTSLARMQYREGGAGEAIGAKQLLREASLLQHSRPRCYTITRCGLPSLRMYYETELHTRPC